MQIHIGEVGIGSGVDEPTLLMVLTQTIPLRQNLEQFASKTQTFCPIASPQAQQSTLRSVNFPASAIGIKEKMDQPSIGQH